MSGKNALTFELLHTEKSSSARAGKITTDHGKILTPIFMPVGTAGTVKAVHQRELRDDISAQIILGNTYHLYLRPGPEIMEAAGGLHKFNAWEGPILTDSGGYQVYSLSENRKIREEGATFKSHIDGSSHLFSPERVMDIQRIIGADIMMAFDECPPHPAGREYVEKSMQMTHRWLDRCFARLAETEVKYGHRQAFFPIVQGGTFPALRRQAAEHIGGLGADGNAIGGLSVGEPAPEMYAMTGLVCEILPVDKPRYLMGVGTPADILEGIGRGVDMFDCVMPTRNARNGMVFTTEGIMNLRNEKWKSDFSPLDAGLGGYAGTTYSKAYVRHLVKSKEMLGAQIASVHNLTFYLWLVGRAREQILNDNFTAWKSEVLPRLMRRL